MIDFVEGRVKIELFLEELDRNNALYEWIQSIVPKGKIGYYDVKKIQTEVLVRKLVFMI